MFYNVSTISCNDPTLEACCGVNTEITDLSNIIGTQTNALNALQTSVTTLLNSISNYAPQKSLDAALSLLAT